MNKIIWEGGESVLLGKMNVCLILLNKKLLNSFHAALKDVQKSLPILFELAIPNARDQAQILPGFWSAMDHGVQGLVMKNHISGQIFSCGDVTS